jgi:hypothetical protein
MSDDYGDYTDDDAEPMPNFGQRDTYDGWPLELDDDDGYSEGEDYYDWFVWLREQPWPYRLRWHLRNRAELLIRWVKGYVSMCPDCHKRQKDCGCIPF